MTKRIVDINGKMVHYPKHYMRSVNTGCKMIDAMERAGIDRSDMSVSQSRSNWAVHLYRRYSLCSPVLEKLKMKLQLRHHIP